MRRRAGLERRRAFDRRRSVEQSTARETVRSIVKTGDPDRYAATLFAPSAARDSLFALYALNVELARIPRLVTEPQLGHIRLQWWRDNLDQAGRGESTGHPVADALGAALIDCGIAVEALSPLLDAHALGLESCAMADWQGLETYLRNSAGTLFQVAAVMLGADPKAADAIAAPASIAYGLTGLMRALPFDIRAGHVYLPTDMLARYGVTELTPDGSNLAPLLADLRARAQAALDEALPRLRRLQPGQRKAFLPLALVTPYLAALERTAKRPFTALADINPLYRFWRLATWRAD